MKTFFKENIKKWCNYTSTSVLPVVETDFSLLYVCTTTSVIFKCWPIPTSFSANSLQSDTLHLPVPSFKVIDLTFTSLPPTDTVLAISSYKTYTATKAVFKREVWKNANCYCKTQSFTLSMDVQLTYTAVDSFFLPCTSGSSYLGHLFNL